MTRILLPLIASVAFASASAQPARDSLEARLSRAPGDAQAHRDLSDWLVAQGQPAAAVPHLSWLAAHAPSDVAVHRRLAQTLLWSDQPGPAAEVLADVVALDPADVGARVQAAEIITWDGGADRAVALLAPVADAHPDDARLHRALAFALLASGDGGARAQVTRALALAPRDPDLLVEGGALERWQGDWSLAQTRLQRALGQTLTDAQRDRVRTLLAGIRDVSAPTVTTTAARVQDSNGVTRTDVPARLTIPVDGRWTVGAEVLRGEIRSATARADGTAFVPFVVYRPRPAVQFEAAVGPEGTPGAPLALHGRVSARRVWTARGFALARLTAATATATDAADALERGLARSTLTAEGYAEPSTALTLSGQLGALVYSDGNRRAQAAAVARWLPLSVGRRAGALPVASAGVTGGAVWEDSATIYPDARPYYTPDHLVTVSAGLGLRVVPGPGVRVDGALGLARQRAGASSAGATAVEYSVAAELDRGAQAVRLELRRSGSSAYSSDAATLTTRFRLP